MSRILRGWWLRDLRGVSQGIAIITILAVGFVGVSTLYYFARQDVYAESSSINLSKLKKTSNTNTVPPPTNGSAATTP